MNNKSAMIISGWQQERERLLQDACQRVKRLAPKHGLLKSIKRVARCLDGRQFDCDPIRRFKLSAKTLVRLFYIWRAGGEKAAAFRMKATRKHSLFTNLVIARFADFLIRHPRRSFRSAWNIFSGRRSNFRGHWRPIKKAVRQAQMKSQEIGRRVRHEFRSEGASPKSN